jgi:predicted MFS family arabinose efflux permease
MRRRAGFAGLIAAETISLFGTRMTAVAIPWLVLVTTGSAIRTGVVGFAEMLPYVLVCAAGGPLIDRVGPRRMSIAMDLASAVVVGAIPLLYWSGRLDFGPLVVLVAVAGTMRGLGDTSKRVVFPATVATGGIDLTRATSIQDGVARLANLLGAPAAGLMIVATDAPTVLLVDAVSFAAAALMVSALVARVAAPKTDPGDAVPYLRQLRDGIGYVRRDRLVLGLLVMLFVTNLLDQAYGTVFVPVWAKEVFGSPVGIGLVVAAFGAGAVVGNLVYTAVSPRLPRWAPYTFGFIIAGMPRYAVLATDSPLWMVLGVSAVGGLAIAAVNPILGAVMYERVPARLQARVLGLSMALAWAGIPLGGLFGGLLADGAGLRVALVVTAVVYLGATLLPLTGRVWREMDLASPPAEAGAEHGQRGGAGRRGPQDGGAQAHGNGPGDDQRGEFVRGDAALRADDDDDVTGRRKVHGGQRSGGLLMEDEGEGGRVDP